MMKNVSKEQADRIFRSCDTSGDNKISLDEFRAMLEKADPPKQWKYYGFLDTTKYITVCLYITNQMMMMKKLTESCLEKPESIWVVFQRWFVPRCHFCLKRAFLKNAKFAHKCCCLSHKILQPNNVIKQPIYHDILTKSGNILRYDTLQQWPKKPVSLSNDTFFS